MNKDLNDKAAQGSVNKNDINKGSVNNCTAIATPYKKDLFTRIAISSP
jgi:hypothetical protein